MLLAPEIIKILQTAPLFKGVPVKLLLQISNEARLRTLKSGETLMIPGQTSNVVYVILSGRLSIQSRDSGVESIAMLGEAESVGETSIIGDLQASAYVIAATDCKLLAIDPAALWELIDSSHQAAHNVLTVLSMRVRTVNHAMPENHEPQHGFSGSAMIDEMTGLYNRQWIEEKIGRYLRRHAFNKQPSCLMMVEIDRFGEFNDKYGQLGSEQALRDIAHTLLSCLHPGDQAGHFIGEQFVVFMPETELPDGCKAAERLREVIAKSVVVLPSGDALPPISVSLGISLTTPEDTPDTLIARAHAALQQAMEGGGNCLKMAG